MSRLLVRMWLPLNLNRWLFHGPNWLRCLAAWWLPRWYSIGYTLEERAR